MKQLFIDNGLEEYQLTEGGALLRFNPKDQNLYARFIESTDKIKAVEKEMAEKANGIDHGKPDAGEQTLKIMRETDRRMKEILNQVFGHNNDFDAILCGVNLMAVGSNGKRLIENVMEALLPVMEAGAKACVRESVDEAKAAREARRSNQ
jgi:hypothetical protein